MADILQDSGEGNRARTARLVPPVVTASEWGQVSRGVRQRVLALEAFLADAYGPGRAFDDGVVPWRLLFTSGEFRREVAGLVPPNGVRLHVASFDLVRDEQGQVRVLADNVTDTVPVDDVPPDNLPPDSAFPDSVLTGDAGVPVGAGQKISEYPSRLLSALRAAAPLGVADPRVVLLTAGERDAAYPAVYAEDTWLARRMGVDLVEGRDLFCRGNRVGLHTADGPRPVDVIYRRVGDDWLDSMHFRPESRLGCPGLVNAARAGHVTIANAIGNGVAAGGLVRARMPDLIRYYLGAEPLLGNAEQGTHTSRRTLRVVAVNDGGDVYVPHATERGW